MIVDSQRVAERVHCWDSVLMGNIRTCKEGIPLMHCTDLSDENTSSGTVPAAVACNDVDW